MTTLVKYKKFAMGGFALSNPDDPPIDWNKISNLGISSLKPLSSFSNAPVPLSTATPAARALAVTQPMPGLQSRSTPDIPNTYTTASGSSLESIISKIASKSSEVTPYLSNISNASRKVPKPTMPILDTFNNLQKVNFANERNDINTQGAAADRATERNVDANTAEAIKKFNQGQQFTRLSAVNERESNTNVNIGNQQAQMDARTKELNSDKMNDFYSARTASQIAQQREQSANVANAGDKMVEIGNEKRKAQVEQDKTRTLASMFATSGVMDRNRAKLKASGVPDPLGIDYKDLEEKKAYGGMMKAIPSVKLYK